MTERRAIAILSIIGVILVFILTCNTMRQNQKRKDEMDQRVQQKLDEADSLIKQVRANQRIVDSLKQEVFKKLNQ
jgi:hypothetical protein